MVSAACGKAQERVYSRQSGCGVMGLPISHLTHSTTNTSPPHLVFGGRGIRRSGMYSRLRLTSRWLYMKAVLESSAVGSTCRTASAWREAPVCILWPSSKRAAASTTSALYPSATAMKSSSGCAWEWRFGVEIRSRGR